MFTLNMSTKSITYQRLTCFDTVMKYIEQSNIFFYTSAKPYNCSDENAVVSFSYNLPRQIKDHVQLI